MGIKEAKLNFILDKAKAMFIEKGIETVTIKDLALEVGVGEATMYRYFTKKQNIVIAIAFSILKEVSDNYFHLSQYKLGYEKIRAFYLSFLEIYKDNPDYYKFLAEFDSYISSEQYELDEYEKAIVVYYEDFKSSYELGLKDGSIKEVANIEIFYLTTTHALLELIKKLASNSKVLKQDVKYKYEQVDTLIKIYLESIRK